MSAGCVQTHVHVYLITIPMSYFLAEYSGLFSVCTADAAKPSKCSPTRLRRVSEDTNYIAQVSNPSVRTRIILHRYQTRRGAANDIILRKGDSGIMISSSKSTCLHNLLSIIWGYISSLFSVLDDLYFDSMLSNIHSKMEFHIDVKRHMW